MTENTIPQTIKLSEQAIQFVQAIRQEEGNINLHLRAYVQGGGCAGFQYQLDLVEGIEPGYEVIGNEVKVLVDPISLQYLAGAEIDYIDDLSGQRFIMRNIKAASTCGCGSSFSVD